MLGNEFFYWSTIRNYVIAFGSLFKDLSIDRTDTDHIKVPISYGPKEKMLARLEARYLQGQRDLVAITLPRTSFEISGINYDPTRKLNKISKIVKGNNIADLTANSTPEEEFTNNYIRRTYTSVPYNIDFSLYIMTKTETDGALILDKIIPLFSPELQVSLRIAPTIDVPYDPSIKDYIENFRDNMDIVVDTPIILNSVTMDDNYESDFTTRRSLIYTLSFTMQGCFYGKTGKHKIIKLPSYSLSPEMDTSILKSKIQFEPYSGSKNWVEVSVDDKDEIEWLTNYS